MPFYSHDALPGVVRFRQLTGVRVRHGQVNAWKCRIWIDVNRVPRPTLRGLPGSLRLPLEVRILSRNPPKYHPMSNTDPQSWEESVVSVRAERRDDDVALSEADPCARIYRGAVVQGVTDDETLIGPLVRLFQTPRKRVDVEERFELYQQVAECAPFGERVEEATAQR